MHAAAMKNRTCPYHQNPNSDDKGIFVCGFSGRVCYLALTLKSMTLA